MKRSFVISIVIAFLALCGLIIYLHATQPAFDLPALIIGNGVIALVCLFSFFTICKGLRSENSNAFIRAKYTGTLVKFFTCLALLILYIFINDQKIHKPTLFLFLGMFIVYSALEAIPLSRLARKS